MHRPLARPLRALLVAVLASLALAACGGGDDAGDASVTPSADTSTVTVKTFTFQPDPIEVEAGTTIRFVNDDAINHTVTSGTREAPTPDTFDGQLPDKGATFELELDEPGTYPYFCTIHPGPGMTAEIVVR